ncbi:MAG: CvpA family protein [Oscillospiraceae bacterium]|nr:CvpA family protein [Oscillospiraceae bacterium]
MKSPLTRVLINLAVTLAAAFVYFYVNLPPINLQAPEFHTFLLLLCALYCGCAVLTSGFQGQGVKGYFKFLRRQCLIPLVVAALSLVLCVLGSLAGSVVFRAKTYAQLLPIETGDFAAEVDEISYDQIPMLDKNSAERLGDRKLGELSDMVSQFDVVDDYTQINYKGRPVRIATLMYMDLIKWFTNRGDGLPAYLVIDMVTQNVELVRLSEGIKYTTAEHFGRNLYRHIRFHYPTYLFSRPVMEVDEAGVPYWICPRLVRTIGLFGGTDVKGAVLVNAITGDSQYYEEVPDWVDNLYPAGLIVQQYDYYGMYHNGFLNSMFGQKDVTVTTDDYNYIAMGDDVWVYTGVTSTGADQSNIGFILTNQRTKESKFYSCAGATEHSAMASAQGQLQHLEYTATFPLLLNVGGQPTYFMAMKDKAQLVKQYAMVNVQQYQIVATGDTVAQCEQNYLAMLGEKGLVDGSAPLSGTETVEGTIAEIRSAVLDGNSVYFIQLIGGDRFYSVKASEQPMAVILSKGDQVSITFRPGEESILEGVTVERR